MQFHITILFVYIVASIALAAGFLYLYYSGRLKILQEKINQLLSLKSDLDKKLQTKDQIVASSNQRNRELEKKLASEESKYGALRDQFEQEVNNSEQRQLEFENLAHKVLRQQTQSFDGYQQKELRQLLSPLQEQIKRFQVQIKETNDASVDRIASLKEQIKHLSDKSDQVSQDANNLAKALKGDSKLQGNWGELVLESILDKSGLVKDREYYVQQSLRNGDGSLSKPDIVIALPDGKKLIIDSKVSLRAYDAMVGCETESEQKGHQKAHSGAVQKHIELLSGKNYQNLYEMDSPDFVLMFIPIDTAFGAALMHEPGLYQYAFDKNIVIVTPSTLLATLKTVETMWRNDKQNRHALTIAAEAGKMYDKFVGFVADMKKIGDQLNTVQKTYNNSMNKLSTGSGNLVTRAEKIKGLGAKASKSLDGTMVEWSHEQVVLE